MTTVTIDNKDYELELLSDNARAQLNMLQFVEREIQRLNAELAVVQTARVGYANALNQELALSGAGALKQ